MGIVICGSDETSMTKGVCIGKSQDILEASYLTVSSLRLQ